MNPATPSQQINAGSAKYLDPKVWEQLSTQSQFDQFATAWIQLQSGMIPECERALLSIDVNDLGRVEISWPSGASVKDIFAPVSDAQTKRRGIILPSQKDSAILVAYPIIVERQTVGAVGMALRDADRQSLAVAMRQLQWGAAWLRERIQSYHIKRENNGTSTSALVLDIIAIAMEEKNFNASATAAVTALAERFGCERVSFGTMRKRSARIVSISHTAHFGREMNLLAMVSAAMEEAVDRGSTIVFPPKNKDEVPVRAHRELGDAHGSGSIVTTPMMLTGRFMGAMTLERARDLPFSADEIETLDVLASALAPVFESKRLNDRSILTRSRDSIVEIAGRFFKRDYAVTKFVTVLILLLSLIFTFWYGDYVIVGDAVVEGREQRAISAGFDGFLRSAPARAGDLVKAGTLLASLDDRDLKLERVKWETERQQHAIAYERALSERDKTGLRVADSQVKQAETQINLIDEQLSRATMLAPFDGLIVSGDHSQEIGAAVQRGDVLFEIAPANSHRIMLSIPEAEIATLQPGMKGNLVLAALPGVKYPIEVKRLTPVAKVNGGQNVFEVEAWPVEETTDLRPGLQGAAKIEAGRARVIWLWTHKFQDWLRFTLWRSI